MNLDISETIKDRENISETIKDREMGFDVSETIKDRELGSQIVALYSDQVYYAKPKIENWDFRFRFLKIENWDFRFRFRSIEKWDLRFKFRSLQSTASLLREYATPIARICHANMPRPL